LNLELVRDVLMAAGLKVVEAHTAQEGRGRLQKKGS
jgi:hypothetical protein